MAKDRPVSPSEGDVHQLGKELAIIYLAKHTAKQTDSATGRHSEPIEITTAMVEAGIGAVDARDRAEGLILPDEEVCLVYRAMEAARE